MSYGVNNIQAPDAYQPITPNTPGSLQVPECTRIDFQISNFPIAYQLLYVDPWRANEIDGRWLDERYLPGIAGAVTFISLDRKHIGFRIRNWVAGQVATVTVESVPADEIGVIPSTAQT